MIKIIILTGSELRHQFFRTAVAAAEGVEVIRTYCEGMENTIHSITREKDQRQQDTKIELEHLTLRADVERDYFESFLSLTTDKSNPIYIPRGTASDYADEIEKLAPDLLIAYGCSLIKGSLLETFPKRFLNVHLGLSPWYRGSGTNFWPLVNGEPEYVGATFMYIDKGVDTGEIIHQIRARVYLRDTPHHIGNRLISDMTRTYIDLIRGYDQIEAQQQPEIVGNERLYKRKDYMASAITAMYDRFDGGLVDKYLDEYKERCEKIILVRQKILEDNP